MGTDKRNRQKQNRAAAREALARRQRRDKVKGRALKWGGLAGLLLVIVVAISVTGGSDNSQVEDTLPAEDSVPALTTLPGEAITGDTPCPATDGTAKRSTSFEKEPPMCIDAAKKYEVPMPLASATRDLIQSLIGRGWTEEDFATLILQQAQASGIKLKPENVPVSDGLSS